MAHMLRCDKIGNRENPNPYKYFVGSIANKNDYRS